jgi:hypothetical protein
MPTTDLRISLKKWTCNSFEDCINTLEEHLDYLIDKQYPNTTPERIKTLIIKAIENGEVTRASLDEHIEHIVNFPGNFDINSLHYLESYLVARLRAVELYAVGNQIQAFSVLAYAAVNIGRLNELIENAHACVMPSYDDVFRTQIAINAANKRHGKLPAVHAHLAKIIRDRKPTHGWPSKNKAADDLTNDLHGFVCITGANLKKCAMKERILSWMRTVPVVKLAIEETLAKKTPVS